MNYKSIIKKQSVLIAIVVVCLVAVLSGTSYALFFQVNTNTDNQVVKAGTLAVVYDKEKSTKIVSTSIVPMDEISALISDDTSSKLFIYNNGSLPANYVLKIGVDTESFHNEKGTTDDTRLVNLKYVKVAVMDENNNFIVEPKTLNEFSLVENESMYELTKGSLDVENNKDLPKEFIVKVWVDESIIKDEAEKEKCLYLKVDVTSTVDESKTEEGRADTASE